MKTRYRTRLITVGDLARFARLFALICIALAIVVSCTTFDQGLRLIELRGILSERLAEVYEALDLGLQDRADEMGEEIRQYLGEIGEIFNRPEDWSFIHRYVYEFIGPRPLDVDIGAAIDQGGIPPEPLLAFQGLCDDYPELCFSAASLRYTSAKLGPLETALADLYVKHDEDVTDWLDQRCNAGHCGVKGFFMEVVRQANMERRGFSTDEQVRRRASVLWHAALVQQLAKERNGVTVFCWPEDRFTPGSPVICTPRASGGPARTFVAAITELGIEADWARLRE